MPFVAVNSNPSTRGFYAVAFVHSRKITSTSMKKPPPVAHKWRPYWVPEPLVFDFGLVNSIAGLGLARLDVELVLFGGGG